MSAPDELKEWLLAKFAAAELALKTREEMARTWRYGTNAEWQAASPTGKSLSKAARLKEAAGHTRIAVWLQRDVDMFRATLRALGYYPKDQTGFYR